MGVCYHMRRFPVGYQSGQLGRTVNPLALPSYVRIVDPPPFFARGFGHGLFCFTALLLHENTKERKGLGTRGGVTAAPENRERSVQAQRAKPSTATENRARDKRATDGAVGTMLTAPFPRRHKRPNRRCRRFRRYRSAPAGRLTKPLAPHSPIGTSQTCRGCRGSWKFGSLDVFCFLWPWKVWPFGPARSVLWGALAPLPLPGRGTAPHTPPINQSLCVLRVLCD